MKANQNAPKVVAGSRKIRPVPSFDALIEAWGLPSIPPKGRECPSKKYIHMVDDCEEFEENEV
jgi:hypothetical protein